MSFYTSIATYYDFIFPPNMEQITFVTGAFKHPFNKLKILDVGCGTGNLTFELAKYFGSILGLEIDEKMLEIARQKALLKNKPIEFIKHNMLNLSSIKFDSFDGIVCFGNTLVHLDGLNEVEVFLKEAYIKLNKNGKLLLQIINYDRILNENIKSLPTIENDEIKFIRNYDYLKHIDRINFKTVLTIKKTGTTIHNEQKLLPITEIDLVKILYKVGFELLNSYGSFKKDTLNINSIQLIIEAIKNY